jgi:outer membrane protein assembly factor BamB
MSQSSARALRASPSARVLALVAVSLSMTAGPIAAQSPPAPAEQRARADRAAVVPESADLQVSVRVTLEAAPAAQAGLDRSAAYVPLRDGRLVAVDLTKGIVRWSIDLATSFAPVTGDGLVFVSGEDMLTALDVEAAVRWTLPMPGGFSAPLFWDTGWLIAGTTTGDVLCIRAADGQVLWTKHVGSPLGARASIAADRVYLPLNDGRLVVLTLQSGEPVWQHQLGDTPGPALVLDERLFVGSKDKFFYCLDTRDGDRKWRWRTGGHILGAPVIDAERVYFTSLDNVLRALDRRNGSQQWKQGLPLRPSGGPLLVGRVLFVAGVSAEVRAYRVEDGAPAGGFEAPMEVAAPPQLLPDDIPELTGILLLTRTGELQVLRRQLEPAIVPLTQPVGVPVPLEAPPVEIAPVTVDEIS